MLIPRFSLRWLLAVTTVCGVLALVVAQAVRGSAWGLAVTWTMVALLVSFTLYASVFLLAYSVERLIAKSRKKKAASPFATDAPPPQYVAPLDPQ